MLEEETTYGGTLWSFVIIYLHFIKYFYVIVQSMTNLTLSKIDMTQMKDLSTLSFGGDITTPPST